MVGGFFPTPYPDECLYSILCRCAVRSGATEYADISKNLFGNRQTLTNSIFLPIRLECIDEWVSPLSGITRKSIALDHTLHPYFNMTYPSVLRTEINNLINSGKPIKNAVNKTTFGRRSKAKHLKYCPLCVCEDNHIYGETYWRRQHQLSEMLYCIRHGVRLVDSSVLTNKIGAEFYPASNVVNVEQDYGILDELEQHKDKFLKIGRECEWLIEHGTSINWSDNCHEKYSRLLRDRGLATFKGICNQYEKLHNEFFDYWGKDFIDELFTVAEDSCFKGWTNKISQSTMGDFTPLHHILLMCYLTGSVKDFIESNPAETPFGHPPYGCANQICPHYHTDGAEIIDMVEYYCTMTAYFECTYCGMLYKYTASHRKRGLRLIQDYGHLWKDELVRCCQDPKMTREGAMEILKCSKGVLEAQKRKHGLMKPFLHDTEMGAENYYKSEVTALCEQYDEVTIALLDEKVPGAYTYLQKNDYDWIRSRVVFDNERRIRIEHEELLLGKLRKIIATFDANGYPDRALSYGYIASLLGVTRDELRYKMSPNSELRAFLDEIVESRWDWRKKRVVKSRITNLGQDRPIRSPPANVRPKYIDASVSYYERTVLLHRKLRDVISNFETDGFPNRRVSYRLLATLVGSTEEELKYKGEAHPELGAYLNEIVERKGCDWRKKRAAKGGSHILKYEKQIRCAIETIWNNPPKEQVSRNYIANVAGIGKDTLKDDTYLSALTKDFVETRMEWHIRRLTTAYHNKPIEGRPYSVGEIRCAASIDYTTYNKHREMFTEIVSDLNRKAEQDNV
ncbi:MAG: TnsD family transposase [Treponema sp.]|nr:TnsD family transposase [Treponema sp.]